MGLTRDAPATHIPAAARRQRRPQPSLRAMLARGKPGGSARPCSPYRRSAMAHYLCPGRAHPRRRTSKQRPVARPTAPSLLHSVAAPEAPTSELFLSPIFGGNLRAPLLSQPSLSRYFRRQILLMLVAGAKHRRREDATAGHTSLVLPLHAFQEVARLGRPPRPGLDADRLRILRALLPELPCVVVELAPARALRRRVCPRPSRARTCSPTSSPH